MDDFSAFVDSGITTFDTADIYGPSERLIGSYLSSPAHRTSGTPCQVFTKFCCFGDSMRQARTSLDFVEHSIDKSRSNLGLDTLDCVQFYWHDYTDSGYVDAAKNLAEVQSKGKINTLGVTNFDTPRLQEIVEVGGVEVRVNQIQYSLLDTRPDTGMVEYCLSKGISICPYGTVAGGFLSDTYLGARPQDVAVNTYSMSKYASVINQRGGWDWFQSLLQVLREVADAHGNGIGIAEVASRWVLQRPAVAAIIVGARNASHVEQHKKIFSFELSGGDLEKIDGVMREGKRPTSDVYAWERGGRW